jgi:hypothetical protein
MREAESSFETSEQIYTIVCKNRKVHELTQSNYIPRLADRSAPSERTLQLQLQANVLAGSSNCNKT